MSIRKFSGKYWAFYALAGVLMAAFVYRLIILT